MSSYIQDIDSSPYVWAADSDDRLEKRSVTLGEYDKENDTYEILDGLKGTDYIVWPSEDCKPGVPVMKNGGEILPYSDLGDNQMEGIGGGDNQMEAIGGGDSAVPSEEVSDQ